MKKILYLSFVLIFSCNIGEDLNQKYIDVTAKKIPKINIYHTDTIIDNYDWMRYQILRKNQKRVMLKLWMF